MRKQVQVSALRKNRSMRVPVDSLAPRTRFGSAIRVGSGMGCDMWHVGKREEASSFLKYD